MAPNVKDILDKYGSKIEKQIRTTSVSNTNYSREYTTFKEEMSPDLSRYEKWCKSLGSVIKLNVSKKDEDKVSRFLNIAHLDIEPWQALTLGVMAFLSVFFFGLLISLAIVLIKGGLENFPLLFFFLMVILSLFLFYFVNGYPERFASQWRLKASSQMVPALLYVVVYMRHTPNLEKAINFASSHLQYPLALDFKKVFYDVEVGKFSTIKESLDSYLEVWRDYAPEFIEGFNLIESSLFEPDNSRRITTLEKALQVVLDGVYDKMTKFTHNVKSPLTNVYMLGVVLPTLALALLPLASAMLQGMIASYHVFVLFNLIVPFLVFYLTDKVLLLRPGGYGESSLLEKNPLYYKYKSNKAYFSAFLICLPIILLGLLPLIMQIDYLTLNVANAGDTQALLGLKSDYTFNEIGLGFFGDNYLFDFRDNGSGNINGPFGLGAVLLSLLLPFGVALFFVVVYSSKTKELIVERDKTKELENEFNNSLFQLGNRLGNGVPAELVFGKVAESARGLRTEDFFKRVNYNIQQMGMGLESAIFDPYRGALRYYPSDLISTSMRVLIESSKKGLAIAAISLMSISEYVKNVQKVTLRLRDMLAEVVSDMKSNMTFLAPLLSGIVISLSVMITAILSKLNITELSGGDSSALGSFSSILEIFDMSKMIPPYYLQIIVGVYLIQIIFILTGALVTVDSGEDKLQKTNNIGSNLSKGIVLYVVAALIATLALYTLANVVLTGMIS
jgi:hypothetical protein